MISDKVVGELSSPFFSQWVRKEKGILVDLRKSESAVNIAGPPLTHGRSIEGTFGPLPEHYYYRI